MVSPPKTPPESLEGAPSQQNVAKEEDEGLDAWLQALGAFLVYTATW